MNVTTGRKPPKPSSNVLGGKGVSFSGNRRRTAKTGSAQQPEKRNRPVLLSPEKKDKRRGGKKR